MRGRLWTDLRAGRFRMCAKRNEEFEEMRKPGGKSCVGLRLLASKRAGMLAAVVVLLSLAMVVSNLQLISFDFQQTTFGREMDERSSGFFSSGMVYNDLHVTVSEDRRMSDQMRKFLLDTRDDVAPLKNRAPVGQQHQALVTESTRFSSSPPAAEHEVLMAVNVSDSPVLVSHRGLPPSLSHPCEGFSYPPPPVDKKKTGPRPCPVCYLPVEQAIQAMPKERTPSSPILKHLSFLQEPNGLFPPKKKPGSTFGGHPTLEQRSESHQIREEMALHCGFVNGTEPGDGTGFDFSAEDRAAMQKCDGVVVGSAIFGNYDELQQPKNISEAAAKNVCFFMFVDEETEAALTFDEGTGGGVRKIGLWSVVTVRNLPYTDPRRVGKIPKLLIHRLFPNARYSLWVDGKLELVVDPYQILERFLWRNNKTFAISKHYARFDVFVEAEANKNAGKYDNRTIDAQVDFYRSEGLTPYTSEKLPIISDVPEGCVIVREHEPVTNLFGCLWFNEVDRFTSRDQISFAIVRDKILAQAPWRQSMFLDCERRNFVVQQYHRDVIRAREERLRKAAANDKTS